MRNLAYWSIFILSDLFARLPAGLALWLGRAGGALVCFFSKRKKNAYADLKAAFGERFNEKERRTIVRRHFENLGMTALEIIRFPSLNQKFLESHVAFPQKEYFLQAAEEGKGVVLLTAHFGNWELLQIVSSLLGKPIYVLARNQGDIRLNEMLNRLRESHGSKAVTRGMGVRGLYRALKSGEMVGLLGDQDAGKMGGVILPFFGRKTTVPTGAFEMARRSGSPILPCYDVRQKDGTHQIFIGEEIHCGHGDYDLDDLRPAMLQYLKGLEEIITRYPEHWLWGSKRWKHAWTKKIVILSDGKRGHEKQSLMVASKMSQIPERHGRRGMSYDTEVIQVRFRSRRLQKLFHLTAPLLRPWIQGRMGWLGLFLSPESVQALRTAYADFVISGGSALVPVNLCLALECCAKSIVLMKPSFPYDFFDYDLAVIPAHDQGRIPKRHLRTLITPSLPDPGKLERDASMMRKELRGTDPLRAAVFLGGNSRHFTLDIGDIEKLASVLERFARRSGGYAVTTSRRTPAGIESFLRAKHDQMPGCRLLVLASQDPRPEVAGGLMKLADILIVTEDSISMISEAIASGKKVIVLTFKKKGLSRKHYRFQRILAQRQAAVFATCDNLETKIRKAEEKLDWGKVLEQEASALRDRLESLL